MNGALQVLQRGGKTVFLPRRNGDRHASVVLHLGEVGRETGLHEQYFVAGVEQCPEDQMRHLDGPHGHIDLLGAGPETVVAFPVAAHGLARVEKALQRRVMGESLPGGVG